MMNCDLNNYFQNVLQTLWTNFWIELRSERMRDGNCVHTSERESEKRDKRMTNNKCDCQQALFANDSPGDSALAGTFKWTQVFPKISHKLPFMLLELTHQTHQFLSKDTIVLSFVLHSTFDTFLDCALCVCTFDIKRNARIASKQLVRHPIDITWSCSDRYNRFSQFQLWRFSSFFRSFIRSLISCFA